MKIRNLKILCCLAYFFSYLTRQNYSAALTEIISDLQIEKSLASIAVTGSFISYGVFQIISGFVGDKFKPQNVILLGLSGSALINVLIWFFPNIYVINALWCLNGAFQSLIWPPLVKIIVDNFSEKDYSLIIVRVTQASYIATVFLYFAVPVVISVASWKDVFGICGFCGVAFAVLWFLKTKNLSCVQRENDASVSTAKKMPKGLIWSMGILPMIICTLVAGFMRDGIATWMPTYINQVYDMGESASILTGAVLPLCCIAFIGVLKTIGEKIGDEIKATAVFFFVALLSCVILWVCFQKNFAIDVFLMALITMCVHGVNLMLVCNVPKFFAKYGKSSTMSGVFNSVVYCGSAISTYGMASFSEVYGWQPITLLWSFVVVVCFVLCFTIMGKYKKFKNHILVD